MNKSIDYLIQPGGQLTGRMRVPGDKSISHRSVMLGSLAEGVTRIAGLLEGEDVLSTLGAFRAMGVQSEGPRNGNLVVHGVGLHGLKAPPHALDMGNSGTAMRLMAGLLAGQSFDSELIGGLIVQIGDKVFDSSVRTRIQTLRAQLMERGTSYVLQN